MIHHWPETGPEHLSSSPLLPSAATVETSTGIQLVKKEGRMSIWKRWEQITTWRGTKPWTLGKQETKTGKAVGKSEGILIL
jgi:hypothetical protein